MTSDDIKKSAKDLGDNMRQSADELSKKIGDQSSSLRDKASDYASQAGDAASDLYGRAKDRIGDVHMPDSASDAVAAGQRAYNKSSEHLGRQISKQPIEALLLAGAIGYLVGWAANR